MAGDIGISSRCLSQFLDGSKVRSQTLRQLRDWFYSGKVAAWLTPEQLTATLAALLNGVGEPGQAEAALGMCQIVRTAHQRQRTPVPPCVDPVIERLRASNRRTQRREQGRRDSWRK